MTSSKKEIGSEFSEYTFNENKVPDLPPWLKWGRQNRLFVSGRTALDSIICDIMESKSFKTIYLPSYCCYSMIEPFISNGIEVKFYDVALNENSDLVFNIDYNLNYDALLIMNYFGYLISNLDSIIERLRKKKEIIIIEDATHSLFCQKAFNTNSDYVFTSFRKWFAIPGGAMASKMHSEFNIPVKNQTHNDYVKLRIESMRLKEEYLRTSSSEKELFLEIFRQSEELIYRDYKGYTIDKLSYSILDSLDVRSLREQRYHNALQLTTFLNNQSNIKPLFRIVNSDECPLFVPVICRKGERDKLKKFLIQNKIYCPVHWPKPVLLNMSDPSDMYDLELSLVCDQRYDTFDMKSIIISIERFYTNL